MRLLLLLIFSPWVYAWDMGDVFSGMSTNVTSPGSYHDQAAGYYSGGGISMRTKRASFQPFAMTPPSIKMGCSGIDMYAGSFSIISGSELVNMAKNLGTQAKSYAFQLALKTFAPQIENLLSKLRDLAMELNEFSVEDCQLTQSLFASALPKDSAMYETVCRDLGRSSGGKDYFKARENCEDNKKAKAKAKEAEAKDKDLLLANYNLFMKAALKAKIPKKTAESMMSIVGTIVMNDGELKSYEPLTRDDAARITHIRGGKNASLYKCQDSECLKITTLKNQTISPTNSYQGKAEKKLLELRGKLINNTAFNQADIGFLSSIGDTFPIYDFISFEAISGVNLIDKSSYLVATYMLLQYVKKIINETRKSLHVLETKQLNDQHIKDYLASLDKLQDFIVTEYQSLMTTAHNLEKKLHYLEAHQLARMRG